jgi:hypothetical protein
VLLRLPHQLRVAVGRQRLQGDPLAVREGEGKAAREVERDHLAADGEVLAGRREDEAVTQSLQERKSCLPAPSLSPTDSGA